MKLVGPEILISGYIALGHEFPRLALKVPLTKVETLTLMHFQRVK